jgi:hypothetical protein
MTDFVGDALPLDDNGLEEATDSLQVSLPALWSVLHVETSGCGYLPDRRPKILFERHYFSRLTDGAFDKDYPDISNPSAGGYGPGGTNQYERLKKAMDLAHDAALKSASWGLGQVMGEHASDIGFTDVNTMVAAMCSSEAKQLGAMAAFIDSQGLSSALRSQNWPRFALGYNGKNYTQNQYDTQLATAYAALNRGALPSLIVRAGQVYLTFLDFDPHGIDGTMGRFTRSAMNEFQEKFGLPSTNDFNDATMDALRTAVAALQ